MKAAVSFILTSVVLASVSFAANTKCAQWASKSQLRGAATSVRIAKVEVKNTVSAKAVAKR